MNAEESLPSPNDKLAFNLARLKELWADPFFASLPCRIETNGVGQAIISQSPDVEHSFAMGELSRLFDHHQPENGTMSCACPVSTVDGIKTADVAWISDVRLEKSKHGPLLQIAPEVCVEVLSRNNTRQEISQKKRLYFEAGAEEVWICGLDGEMEFFVRELPDAPAKQSKLCSDFPKKVGRIPD